MIYELSLNLLPGQEKDDKLIQKLILRTLAGGGTHVASSKITAVICKKKSVDARHGQVKLHLRYAVYVDELPPVEGDFSAKWKKANSQKPVVIVGAGPAGLFAALQLLEEGIKPIIIERGPETADRKIDIAEISRTGSVGLDSNYCFGEGGAGTFSDGKLFSRSHKRGNIGRILAIFNYHGANPNILTDAHPHIGTDKLPAIINNIKKTIISFGGEIHFNTRCTELLVENSTIRGVKALNLQNNQEENYLGKAVILATGHSAIDIYQMVADACSNNGIPISRALVAKPFAMGLRVEHPRILIDDIQYHGAERDKIFPAAEYKLTTQVENRGVYSFCMCPGGLVVPSATAPNQIVVNGMSPSSRNAAWSNSAIVVEIKPEDVPSKFGMDCLAGLHFRTWLEEEAYKQSVKAQNAQIEAQNTVPSVPLQRKIIHTQRAPAQRLTDYLAGKPSHSLPNTSYTPGLVLTRIDEWFPPLLNNRLKKAFHVFDKSMHGFVCDKALLIAPETRTSTPVRIQRDRESLESTAIAGLYPAGEGAGFSGGIVSSAMDGENIAKIISKKM
ncbi:MAG: FAD-binding protein [Treponema sp. CETP13]|nr:MAG: FAD-binding protein [Treponema sp. CETP13]